MTKPDSNQESIIKIITDLTVWVLFVVSILSSITLLVTGTITLIIAPSLTNIIYFLGAFLALGIQYLINSV